MKLEELYLNLQERYPIEQEKKAAAEKSFKEELKNEILKIIHFAQLAIEGDSENVYTAYEQARERVGDISNKPVYISFKIGPSYIDCFMHIELTQSFITRFMLESDVCEHLNSLLDLAYRFNNRGEEHRVRFDSYIEFSLTESTIKLGFSAKPSASGGFTDEERKIIKKFISDIKEMFPNSEEIPEPGEVTVDLTVTLKCYGIDINTLVQSAQNSNSFSCIKDNNMTDKQKLLAMSVHELNLSTRAYNVMKYKNILTVGDLVQIPEKEFKLYKNVGAKTVKEIREKLLEIGLTQKS